MKKLLIGAIGAVFGAVMTLYGVLISETIDLKLEFKQAQVDLSYASNYIDENLKNKESEIPLHAILDSDANWSFVFAEVRNKDLENVYYEIKRLDQIRDYIITAKSVNNILDNDKNGIDDYLEKYYLDLEALKDSNSVNEFNEYLIEELKYSYDFSPY